MATFETKNYGTVEAALAHCYGVPNRARGAFRARLGALQKGGLFGPKHMPGRGHALAYGPDQFHRLIFACEMLEAGIVPSVVLAIVKARWDSQLRKIFRSAEDAAERDAGPADVLYIVPMRLFTEKTAPDVIPCYLERLPDYLAATMMKPDGSRALITNLSMRLRSFHAALADSYMGELRTEARRKRGR